MENREDVLKALNEGKELTSAVTGITYKLINGLLHAKSSERSAWEPSALTFYNPISWRNLSE